MSLYLLYLKATAQVNWGWDLALGMILVQLDILILLRLIWLIKRWR